MASFIEEGIAFEKLPELNEISWGNREGQVIDADGDRYYFKMINEWVSGNTDFAIDGGESPKQVAERMRIAIKKIMSNDAEREVLICMHGRALRILLTVLLNYPLSAMDMFDHKNLCLYELENTGSFFKLNKYNETSHLSDLTF